MNFEIINKVAQNSMVNKPASFPSGAIAVVIGATGGIGEPNRA
jgi:hypothetical protein